MTGDKLITGKRVRDARLAAGLSIEQVAKRSGRSLSGIRALENGQNGLKPDAARELAPILKTTAAYLLTGTGEAVSHRRTVPLVGFVGAGAEAHYYDAADLGEVEAPEGATETTVAAEIRGESLGPLFDHWLVFYDEVRTPVTPDLIGRLCVVGLPNGKVLVKKIQKSRADGLYHLLSNTEAPILDQEIDWAARVKHMEPR